MGRCGCDTELCMVLPPSYLPIVNPRRSLNNFEQQHARVAKGTRDSRTL